MARLFISHSSHDNAAAIALRGWLAEQGWDDVFLDLDPERGIVSGERWERALHQAASRCEAVVFLLSKRWFASGWCRREFELALRLGKRVFGVVIDATRTEDIPPEYRDTWQLTRLSDGQDGQLFPVRLPPDGAEEHVVFSREGLQRLRRGLQSAGLDPRHFDWPPPNDPDRPPYRGLRPLEAADAGIFFGREAPLIDALDQLRGLRDRAAPRLFVVLGASGAGKSSFLRAGLLPRLARDDRHWRALPPIRPQGAVLDGEQGLVAALHRAFIELGRPRARPALAVAANTPDGLMALLAELAAAATPPTLPGEAPAAPPTILLAVDQAEELFQADGAAQSRAFLELLAAIAQAETLGVLVLFTIRTDLYGPLQEAAALAGLRQQTFPLPPLHPTSYPTIIEGPARRLEGPRALSVPAKLTQDLAGVAAAGGGDALPLLAFTLETLWHDHGATGRLAPEGYDASAGFAEAISAAVLRAMTAAVRAGVAPAEEAARLALLRRGLIPWLAGIDPATNAPRRRRARLSDIPAEARGLIEHLVEARLLSADTNAAGEPVLEPAHDALLRRWGILRGWLEEDAALLAALEAVQEAARDWDANARDAAWLAHRAGRLESAEALRARDDLWAGLGTAERAYLGACRAAEDAARDRELAAARELAETERRGRKRAMVGLAAASLAALVAIGASWWAWHQEGVAENARKEAERQGQMARLSYETAIKSLAGMVGDIQRRIPLGSTTSYSGNVERELISGTTAQQLAEFPLNAFNELDRLGDFRQDASLNRGRAALFGSIREIFSQTGALDKALEAARLEVQARRYLFQVQDDQGSARDLVVSLVGSARLLHQFSGTINQEWRILVDEAREIADRVSNTLEFADRRAWRVQMSQVYSAMSDGYLLGREFQIANDFAQLAFEQIDELADDPDFGLSRRRAIALGRLSDTFVALNVQDKAIDLMERNVKLSRELVERTRGNPSGTQHIDARRGLSIALERMSFLELWRSGGNPYTTYNLAKEAINYLPSLRGMDGVQLCFASSESLNPNWLQTRFYSNIQYLRALLLFQDDLEKREELLKVSKCMLDIIERLRLINFSSPATERNEAVAALYRARALRIGGDIRGSANYYVHCLQRRFPSFYWLRSAGDQDILRLCADELVIVTGP